MTDQELQQWVEQISLDAFGRPFKHKASFNHRLRSTGGRYFSHTHHIEISWRQYEEFGAAEVEKIIKHELCHYHLHLLGLGYQHRDADFKQLLRKVGGSRYCQRVNAPRREPYRYRLQCRRCGKGYLRKRKVNVMKYVCGICKGKLEMFPLDAST